MALSFIENGLEDDEYIDMEITSFSNFFSNSRNSREFEFQMSSLSIERDSTTSPADELFYNGKLLPLHLLRIPGSGSVYGDNNGVSDELYGTPLATTTVTTPTSTSTPFESCNISPCDSCSVSRELNPDEYSLLFFKYSSQAEQSGYIDNNLNPNPNPNPKKSWTKKFKLTSKLKASRTYLKDFFGKSNCTDKSSTATKYVDVARISKTNERQFGHINEAEGKGKLVDNGNRHRRSFSIARYTSTKKSSTSSSSSNSSTNSNNSILQFLKRSSSVNVEIESPIQGAIAHCKQSQRFAEAEKNICYSNSSVTNILFDKNEVSE